MPGAEPSPDQAPAGEASSGTAPAGEASSADVGAMPGTGPVAGLKLEPSPDQVAALYISELTRLGAQPGEAAAGIRWRLLADGRLVPVGGWGRGGGGVGLLSRG